MPNQQVHDTVFRDYFNDQTRLLSLCNAMLSTAYDNPADVEINTLEGNFFSNVKNDISCLLHESVVTIIEHQTTINENMPYRCYEYSHGLYQKITSGIRSQFYGSALIKLPRPYFATIYEGKHNEFSHKTMHLSAAFGLGQHPLELKVDVFNLARLDELPISACRYLRDYRSFIYRIDHNKHILHMEPDRAVQEAADYCLANGIMPDYLKQKKSEVFNMLTYEWNETEAHNAWKEEGRKEGREEGREEGRKEEQLNSVRNLMETTKWTAQQAMNAMRLTPEQQRELAPLI